MPSRTNLMGFTMNIADLAAGVSPDGRAITRETLEECFWLPASADSARMLKTFADGRQRIVAVAERRMRARPDRTIQLTIGDFLGKR